MTASVIIAIVSAAIGQTTSVVHSGVSFTTDLQFPGRLASDEAGGVYVTDPPTDRVLHYDAAGSLVEPPFVIPEGAIGIAVSLPNIFVSRRDDEVGVYDAAFVEQAVLPQPPAPVLPLAAPNDLAIDPVAGEVYVADSENNHILAYDATTLVYRTSWGVRGTGAGQFESPQALALDVSDPDPANHRVYVADVDGFRVQAFDTDGMPKDGFGYRTLYVGDPDDQVAWFARSAGLAVDECGSIYVSDALMGTVRVFDAGGSELDLDPDPNVDHVPAINYGASPGVRLPCDIMIVGGKLFVASTGNSSVEVYDVVCTPPGLRSSGDSTDLAVRPVSRKKLARPIRLTDTPFAIAEAAIAGEYSSTYDLNRDRTVDVEDVALATELFGAGTVELFMTGESADPSAFRAGSVEGPHLNENLSIACWRCHAMNGLPNGERTAEGQENLCLSCHSSANLALEDPIAVSDKGFSHPVGIPADQEDVLGPGPETLLSWHLDDEGDIRCGTCHNPHTSDGGEPYLRATIGDASLCGQCHVQADQWALAGHSDGDATAFNYPTGPGRESCAKCHSGLGHIDFANGVPEAERRTDKQVHSCFVCHGVHDNGNHDLLRIQGDVELPGGHIVSGGDSANCMVCHNGRYAPNTGHSTPHYLPGAVVLLGLNGIDFGNTIDMSAHTVLAKCTDCHMADTPGTPKDGVQEPGEDKVGGHTFNLVYHDETGVDPDDGFENAENACGTCHPGLTTVNRTAWADYDGSGVTQGIQDELTGLLAIVHAAIEGAGAVDLGHYPYWSFSGVDPLVEQTVRDAVWNYELIENDRSLGVHNVGFSVGLLQATYRELTGMDVPGASLRYTFGPNARRGGLLYDKWWAVNGAAAPTGNHPLYPPTSAKSGSTTFRCKECHGWDYIGKDGRYESGSHYTGIIGVIDAATNWTDQELFDIIKNPDGDGTGGTTMNGHDFGAYGLSDFDILDLVEFLKTEVIDTSPYISRSGVSGAYTYDFIGDVGNGFGYYSAGLNADVGCYRCHGTDGRAIDFGGGEFVGTVAAGNPQEALHKIRFGQPATTMPSLVHLGIGDQSAADIGAYAQTLPTAAAVGGDTVRGGLLYDKWWKVNGAAEPTGDHPLYPATSAKSGSTTYRCKECHGWDYIGKDGRYESGSHYTGIIGVLNATTNWTDAELFDIIKNPDGDGTGGTTVNGHDMGTYGLSDTDIDDLVSFLNNSVIDTSPYINRAGVPGSYTYSFNGNSGAGATLYSGGVDPVANCTLCHGADGTAIDFGGGKYVGTVANDNPQETLHKIRFGQPAAGMCSYVRQGLTDQQATDTGAFCETLPQ